MDVVVVLLEIGSESRQAGVGLHAGKYVAVRVSIWEGRGRKKNERRW